MTINQSRKKKEGNPPPWNIAISSGTTQAYIVRTKEEEWDASRFEEDKIRCIWIDSFEQRTMRFPVSGERVILHLPRQWIMVKKNLWVFLITYV